MLRSVIKKCGAPYRFGNNTKRD